ncbi:ketimine reductase mu-crystallin-like isoform X2 [Patiria miniata]|uniref:Ketimine reductase mu-crystallin n=1 Tax=Patiria miniata TaxID=46514 RepID=A0A914AY22_PATMI|nr:ketimine reductase mu-crystallin-like isoform X2 [Patiria miniata]
MHSALFCLVMAARRISNFHRQLCPRNSKSIPVEGNTTSASMSSSSTSIPFISSQEAEKALTYAALIPAIEQALGDFSNGEQGGVVQPLRSVFPVKKQDGYFLSMPAYSEKQSGLACKLLTLFPKNENTKFPVLQGTIALFDPDNGSLKAILDGEAITGMRTAAASAVATKYLAPEGSKILAILGAGLQASTHLQALRHVIPFSEVRVWNRTYARAEAFAAKYGCIACKTGEEAVKDADVIATVTGTSTPILQSEWVKDGAHINCVGAPVPDQQELDPALVRRSVIYADSKEAALNESGDVVISKAEVFGEIGEVVLGKLKARRNETTIFKSLGMALEDVVAAKLVYDKLHGGN